MRKEMSNTNEDNLHLHIIVKLENGEELQFDELNENVLINKDMLNSVHGDQVASSLNAALLSINLGEYNTEKGEKPPRIVDVIVSIDN